MSLPKPFDFYIFNELDSGKYNALNERIQKHAPHSNYLIYNKDANKEVAGILSNIPDFKNGKGNLLFCFIDPFSLNLNFTTIHEIAKYRADILMLMALQMDARRNFKIYLNEENKRIENFLGTSTWRTIFEEKYEQKTFIKFLSDQYDSKMEQLGYKVNDNLKQPIRTDSGLGLYYMAFYSKHPLGNDFYKKINTAANDQLTLF